MLASKFAFEAIGTNWTIDSQQALSLKTKSGLKDYIEQFDKAYSRFRSDSVFSKISKIPGTYTLPPSADEIFALYDQLYEATDGAMSPAVGDSLEALGYGADYSLKPGSPQPAPDYRSCVVRSEATLTTKKPVTLDIGAAGKGYLIDKISEIISVNHPEYILDGSGDIRVSTETNQKIGLEHPKEPQKVIGHVDIKDKSICASSVNRRKWGEGLHHVVDARTGKPTETILATWVIADTAFTADGLATALFFISPEKLARSISNNFHYAIVDSSGAVKYSQQFPGEIYS